MSLHPPLYNQPVLLKQLNLVSADEFLPQVEADALLGDKSFDADKRVREVLRLRGIRCVILFKKNREYDKELYKERHLIENFFCKLKQRDSDSI
jgi:hypothetical protein